jgi:hypothetical protein
MCCTNLTFEIAGLGMLHSISQHISLGHNVGLRTLHLNYIESNLPLLLPQVKSLDELIINVSFEPPIPIPGEVWAEVDRILGESQTPHVRKVTLQFTPGHTLLDARILEKRMPLCAARGILNFIF